MHDDTDDEFDGIADETRIEDLSGTQPSEFAGPNGMIRVEPLPPGLKAELEVSSGPRQGARWPLERPMVMVGRVPDVVDIVVEDDLASRHHAAIAYRGGKFTLYDMGSTNGTVMGGNPVQEEPLADGDSFSIGKTTFIFRIL